MANDDAVVLAGAWRRYFARVTDMLFFGSIYIVVLTLLVRLGETVGLTAYSDVMAATFTFMVITVGIASAALEMLWYRYLGLPPGKRLFALTVTDLEGRHLPPKTYARRTLMMSLACALFLPVISLVCLLWHAYALKAYKTTTYDKKNYQVRAGVWHTEKKCLAVLLSVVIVLLHVIGLFI
jgi:uncharacterized RDD family membrane protein YckC